MSPKDFKVGQVYRMRPTTRSHVRNPYYVEIVESHRNEIVTFIPGRDTRVIRYNTAEWDYHMGRMDYVGVVTDKQTEAILYNQVIK